VTLVNDPSVFGAAPLGELGRQLRQDLEELRGELGGENLPPDREARLRTARGLIDDALALTNRLGASSDALLQGALVNLLYDVSLVAAEYYKMFVRQQTVPRRPAPPG
jgi:hypothetical protein